MYFNVSKGGFKHKGSIKGILNSEKKKTIRRNIFERRTAVRRIAGY